MLLTQASRDAYSSLTTRWAGLQAWLATNVTAAHPVAASIASFYTHWQAVDQGLLTDPDELSGAVSDIYAAEGTAADVGYPLPPEHDQPTHTMDFTVAGEFAQAADDACAKDPNAAACYVTPKGGASWCQQLGVPSLMCGKDGLEDWFLIVAGVSSLAVFGGLVYVAFKGAQAAAPYALAIGAPELLPAYAALRRPPEDRHEALLQAAAAYGAQRRG